VDERVGGFDNEVEWFHSQEHFVRSGYAWVGVSAQNVGVTALKQRMGDRYGALDVTDNGSVGGDGLSYDIFTAAGLAVRGKGGQNVMGPLRAERLIASGHSQSAGRLATYFNSVHPLTPAVYDAVLLHGGGGRMRPDSWSSSGLRPRPTLGQVPVRRADSAKFGTWGVGVSHLDHTRQRAGKPGRGTRRRCLNPPPAPLPGAAGRGGPFGGGARVQRLRASAVSHIPGEYAQTRSTTTWRAG
jgi:hypothetical protein